MSITIFPSTYTGAPYFSSESSTTHLPYPVPYPDDGDNHSSPARNKWRRDMVEWLNTPEAINPNYIPHSDGVNMANGNFYMVMESIGVEGHHFEDRRIHRDALKERLAMWVPVDGDPQESQEAYITMRVKDIQQMIEALEDFDFDHYAW